MLGATNVVPACKGGEQFTHAFLNVVGSHVSWILWRKASGGRTSGMYTLVLLKRSPDYQWKVQRLEMYSVIPPKCTLWVCPSRGLAKSNERRSES
jgi:hypothetical protein